MARKFGLVRRRVPLRRRVSFIARAPSGRRRRISFLARKRRWT